MTKLFRSAFLDYLEQPKALSLAAWCDRASVSYEQMKKVKQGKTQVTNVDDARRLANAIGVTLDEFLGDDTALLRSQIVDLYNQLTDTERAFLRAAAEDARARDLAAEQ